MLDYYGGAIARLRLLPDPGSRVLEIGAGYSWVSRASKYADPTCITVAQDISAECSAQCSWVNEYYVGTLESMHTQEPFDLISMTHVIEHLVEPDAMLESIAQKLKKRGKLFVTAPYRPAGWKPNCGIEAWRTYSYLHVPAHVTYFSRKWFKRVASRFDLSVTHWDATHDDGQAFELVLEKR
jgi:2-polyprenyl-3-methyl-5-hydroxy-6-metoxy-1,4-benzoquinol methylase